MPLHSQLALNSNCARNSVFSNVGFHNTRLTSSSGVLPSDREKFTPIVRNVTHNATRIAVGRGKCSVCGDAIPPKPFAVGSVCTTNGDNSLRMAVGRTSNDARVFAMPCSSIPLLRHRKRAHCSVATKRCHDKGTRRRGPHFFRDALLRNLPTN